jgi:hypothetical protein
MQPPRTDNDTDDACTATETRWRSAAQLPSVHACAAARHRLPTTPGRPWRLPLDARVLLVLIHPRTNPTTRVLAVLVATTQSTVDRILHHLRRYWLTPCSPRQRTASL